ncbi:PEGA domain-containing protein [Desulfoplanes sp.]
MNIGPAYSRGMELDAGTYDVLVSKSGYQTLRRTVAVEQGEDVYVDFELEAEAAAVGAGAPGREWRDPVTGMPDSMEKLRQLKGFGKKRVGKYGRDILNITKLFRKNHPVETANQFSRHAGFPGHDQGTPGKQGQKSASYAAPDSTLGKRGDLGNPDGGFSDQHHGTSDLFFTRAENLGAMTVKAGPTESIAVAAGTTTRGMCGRPIATGILRATRTAIWASAF